MNWVSVRLLHVFFSSPFLPSFLSFFPSFFLPAVLIRTQSSIPKSQDTRQRNATLGFFVPGKRTRYRKVF